LVNTLGKKDFRIIPLRALAAEKSTKKLRFSTFHVLIFLNMKNHSRALRFFSVETSGDYLSQLCPPFFSIYHSFEMAAL
jgi:hypothetical protein